MAHSPIVEGGRSPKRQKALPSATDQDIKGELVTEASSGTSGYSAHSDGQGMPSSVVDIVPGGDLVLGVSGLAGSQQLIGLRVFKHALAMTSPVFKALVEEECRKTGGTDRLQAQIDAKADDGDTMLLLCNILHLRNDKLPSRLPAEGLHRLAALAEKYKCIVAVSRATAGWFDRIYNAPSHIYVDTFRITEATLLLDEPTYFARFTERWIKAEPSGSNFAVPLNADARMKNLATELRKHRDNLCLTTYVEIDLLVEPCSLGFLKANEHYIDYAPGMTPDPDDNGRIGGSICHVDEQAGTLYLGSLREAHIWPASVRPATLGAIIEAIKEFRVPEYDDCDKCDFCEDVKGRFNRILAVLKLMHADRLWGLCLDCFQAGGFNAGECRYEHMKPKA